MAFEVAEIDDYDDDDDDDDDDQAWTSFRLARGNLKVQGDGSLVFVKSSFKWRFDI